MAIADIPILSMLRTRMQWHQERQRVLSENVANSDTPNFRPSDLREPDFGSQARPGGVSLIRSDPAHIASIGDTANFRADHRNGGDIRPAGNAVHLEDEMMKVAQNQMDYQAATAVYTRSLGLIKVALGKR